MKEIMYSNSYREKKSDIKKEKSRLSSEPDTLIVHQGGMKEDSYHEFHSSHSCEIGYAGSVSKKLWFTFPQLQILHSRKAVYETEPNSAPQILQAWYLVKHF